MAVYLWANSYRKKAVLQRSWAKQYHQQELRKLKKKDPEDE